VIDTVGNPNNIWFIGNPSNAIVDSSFSIPNCIFTNSSGFYPTRDTSSFILKHYADNGFTYPHTAVLSCYYRIDSDTLSDFGTIEFSPNNGRNWYNLLDDNLEIYESIWAFGVPVLSGYTKNWKEMNFFLDAFSIYNEFQTGDTVLIRFSFISDSIQNYREGWFLDNFGLIDIAEGIPGYNWSIDSRLFPNPSSIKTTISFDNQEAKLFSLSIYDNLGRLVTTMKDIVGNQVEVDLTRYQPGIYFYILCNEKEKVGARGKILVE